MLPLILTEALVSVKAKVLATLLTALEISRLAVGDKPTPIPNLLLVASQPKSFSPVIVSESDQ